MDLAVCTVSLVKNNFQSFCQTSAALEHNRELENNTVMRIFGRGSSVCFSGNPLNV